VTISSPTMVQTAMMSAFPPLATRKRRTCWRSCAGNSSSADATRTMLANYFALKNSSGE